MKEDYLWDKTGESPEIERLENALKSFRYQEIAPPALPAKIIPCRKGISRKSFSLAFAFAACTAFVIVSLSIWFLFSSRKIEVAKDLTETFAPQIDRKISDKISVEKTNDLIVRKAEIPKKPVKRNIVKTRQVVLTKTRQDNLAARNVKTKKPSVKLTNKEKYAYDQLMLALSITSSKLKLVTDKIDGGEKQDVGYENKR